MNICLISSEYPPETGWGGIGTYTYNMAHAFSDSGHEVHVIAQAVGDTSGYMDKDVYVHRIKPRSIFSPFLRGALDKIKYSFQIYQKIKSIDCEFDIVEAPEWSAEGFIHSFSNKPLLITRLHTPLFLVKQIADQKMTTGAKTTNFLEKTQTKQSYGITSPTNALAKRISKKWNIDLSSIQIIPNGINLKKIGSMDIKEKSLNSDYLVYVGRLEPRKGVHILAKALPGIFRKYPNLIMVFIGKNLNYRIGTMKEFIIDVNREYKENIIFTGFVSDEDKYSLIKHCKLVILPSLWENFPYTCLESMALGKAIIATKGSGYDEIIEDGRSGFLVEAGNFFSLQSKIIECLDNDDKISQIEHFSKKRVIEFDVTKVSEKTCKYYKKLIDYNE